MGKIDSCEEMLVRPCSPNQVEGVVDEEAQSHMCILRREKGSHLGVIREGGWQYEIRERHPNQTEGRKKAHWTPRATHQSGGGNDGCSSRMSVDLTYLSSPAQHPLPWSFAQLPDIPNCCYHRGSRERHLSALSRKKTDPSAIFLTDNCII